MKILISNDDGIMSPGIHILAETLNTCGEVTVVAPSQERSATAHSLTLHKPLRLHIMKPEFYHVNGTPADCVYLALKKICRDKKPDIVFFIKGGYEVVVDEFRALMYELGGDYDSAEYLRENPWHQC